MKIDTQVYVILLWAEGTLSEFVIVQLSRYEGVGWFGLGYCWSVLLLKGHQAYEVCCLHLSGPRKHFVYATKESANENASRKGSRQIMRV